MTEATNRQRAVKGRAAGRAAVKPYTGFVTVMTNVLIVYLVMLVILFALAAVITYTDFPESYAGSAIFALTILSVVLVGILAARGAPRHGWMWGMCGAVFYTLLLYLLGSVLIGGFTVGVNFVAMAALVLLAGALGGVIGINLGRK